MKEEEEEEEKPLFFDPRRRGQTRAFNCWAAKTKSFHCPISSIIVNRSPRRETWRRITYQREMEEEEEGDILDRSPLFRAPHFSVLPVLRRQKQVLSFSDFLYKRKLDWRRTTLSKRKAEEEDDTFDDSLLS